MSRLSNVTSTAEGTATFSYDSSSQLKSAIGTQPAESYSYDSNGNRNMSGYVTSTDNRTTSDPNFNYEYDAEGNLTRKTNKTFSQDDTFYQYDHRNRLTRVQFGPIPGANNYVTYEYDGFNRLVRRFSVAPPTYVSEATYWIYDEGINPVLELTNNISGNGYVTNRYLWSNSVDDLLADEQVNPSNNTANTLYPLSDHLGSIRDIADFDEATGITAIANHRRYDSFGKLTQETGTADIAFGYTGKLYDKKTGIQNNWNRWYDPNLGKWISQDPLGFEGGDPNLYRYVGNGVSIATDPSGLEGWEIGGLTPAQWTYATGVLFYEWGANGCRAVHGIASGSAGRNMGDRAVAMSQNQSGQRFDGDLGDWLRFSHQMAGEMTGANAIAEGAVGIDMAVYRELDAWERGTRISSGTGAMAGSAAGGLGIAGRAGVGIGNIRVPYTPNIPVIPLPDFMRRPLIRRSGTMTAAEEAEILGITNEFETTVDVVGSRAKGTGRSIGTNLPKGKGKGTRSDIDFRIDLGHPTVPYMTQALECVNGGIGSASIKHGFSRPTFPPFFRVSPNGVIFVGPSFGGAGIGIGVGGSEAVNYDE
jgi:RHS repeat-associated protein